MCAKQPVTQKDIARALGISQVTVSRALARNPAVPAALQARVEQMAQKLGYRPDPMLSRLSAYRQSRAPVERTQALAWISGHPEPDSWFYGASERAPRHGYRLEVFNPYLPNMSQKRLMSIIYNQGITGLIFPPQSSAHSRFEIDLSKFCAVTIGYTLRYPNIDRIITDHYINMITLCTKLAERGYRRIGYVYTEHTDQRLDGRELSAYLYRQHHPSQQAAIPPLKLAAGTEEEMDAVVPCWLKKWKPDAVITHQAYIIEICRRLGLQIPGDIGIASQMLGNGGDTRSGIDQLLPSTGALAVDAVVSLLRGNERGVPERPRTVMVPGVWVDGRTTRPPAQP